MKKLLIMLLPVILCNVNLSFCQISYQKSYPEALEKATALKKNIFINITSYKAQNVAGFKDALDNEDVISFYNKNFINYTVSINDTVGRRLLRQYKLNTFPAYLFVDNKGSLIYKGSKSSTSSKSYLDLAQKALYRLSTGKVLSNYEAIYKSGKINGQLLKDYISLREELGLFDNAKLIDEYVDYLTIGAFKDYNEVLFVLKAGPYAYGKSYKLAYTHHTPDSIYKSLPLQERIAINNRIINNTQNEAIRTKNLALAQSAMNFVLTSWGSNYKEGNKQSRLKILTYYKAVKDTAAYYSQAQYFYDTHYMKISADSVRNMEIKKRERINNLLKQKSKIATKGNINSPGNKKDTTFFRTYMVYGTQSDNVANILNNAAYDFYWLGTKNGNYLTKALLWSRRAIELNPIPGYYDTLAHIFYRLGFYEEAIGIQNKAVEMASDQRRPKIEIEHLKSEAQKIKDQKL